VDWAKLVVDLVSSLAWPITVAVILLTFRRPIADRIYDVQKAELPGGIKVELLQHLDRAKEKVAKGKRREAEAELKELQPLVDALLNGYHMATADQEAIRAENLQLRNEILELRSRLAEQRVELYAQRQAEAERLLVDVERARRAGYEAGSKADIGDPADNGE
jgi:hypothetical protein